MRRIVDAVDDKNFSMESLGLVDESSTNTVHRHLKKYQKQLRQIESLLISLQTSDRIANVEESEKLLKKSRLEKEIRWLEQYVLYLVGT